MKIESLIDMLKEVDIEITEEHYCLIQGKIREAIDREVRKACWTQFKEHIDSAIEVHILGLTDEFVKSPVFKRMVTSSLICNSQMQSILKEAARDMFSEDNKHD
jgi:hypothetical protein